MKPNRTKSAGISLLEMLLAITLLAVVMALLAVMLNHVSLTASHFQNEGELQEQVRVALNRMGDDLAHRVVGADVDSLLAKQSGNSTIYFFSEAPGYFITSGSDSVASGKKSGASLIGYAVDRDHRLVRLSKGLTWSDAENALPHLPVRIAEKWRELISAPRDGIDTASDPYFHVASAAVFRLECVAIARDGKAIRPGSLQQSGSSDVVTIRVAVAAVPAEWRARIADWDSLTAMFPSKDDAVSPAAQWQETLNRPDFAAQSGLPKGVAAHIRVFERHFSIP